MDSKKEKIRFLDGIVIGNIEDKSNQKNPISRVLVNKFDKYLFDLIDEKHVTSIHEIGCGEGRITRKITQKYNIPVRASDISEDLINELSITTIPNLSVIARSIYNLEKHDDSANLIICCEVLEHLEHPKYAMNILKKLGGKHYILSVPREPLWRILNMARGKYLKDFGNTPGHMNHWSKQSFLKFLNGHGFRIMRIVCPLPGSWSKALFKINHLTMKIGAKRK